jgi:hypothetical protein
MSSPSSSDRPLEDFPFTFESYLDDSVRIEPDVCAVTPTLGGPRPSPCQTRANQDTRQAVKGP